MALSPNYGFPEPDNSSLVKNGAQDIRALGDAVDTAIWNVGFGQAGKNRIINGDFNIWQRGTSFTGFNTYTSDRWFHTYDNAPTSSTVSRQAFTAGTAPVAGYESQFFLRMGITTAGTATSQFLYQKVEDVRTLAGNPVTYSFWAKADTARTIGVYSYQNFGSGGSADVSGATTNFNLTTSWQRFSMSVTLGTMTGKTIGAGSFVGFVMTMPAVNGAAIDFWGCQLEYGSKATPFETATGTIQGETSACMRYYWQSELTSQYFWSGQTTNTNNYYATGTLPVTMRVAPTVTLTNRDESSFAATAGAVIRITTNSFLEYRAATATNTGGYYGSSVVASAEL